MQQSSDSAARDRTRVLMQPPVTESLAIDRAAPAAQHVLLYLAGRRLRQLGHEVKFLRHLEMREMRSAELAQLGCAGRRLVAQHDERVRRLAPFLARHAYDRG